MVISTGTYHISSGLLDPSIPEQRLYTRTKPVSQCHLLEGIIKSVGLGRFQPISVGIWSRLYVGALRHVYWTQKDLCWNTVAKQLGRIARSF